MINLETARDRVQFALKSKSSFGDAVLLEEETRETEYGWVFFYQSRRYVETRDFGTAFPDAPPYLVLKQDGLVISTAA